MSYMNAVDMNVLIYACDQAHPREQKLALDLIAGLTDGVLLSQPSRAGGGRLPPAGLRSGPRQLAGGKRPTPALRNYLP